MLFPVNCLNNQINVFVRPSRFYTRVGNRLGSCLYILKLSAHRQATIATVKFDPSVRRCTTPHDLSSSARPVGHVFRVRHHYRLLANAFAYHADKENIVPVRTSRRCGIFTANVQGKTTRTVNVPSPSSFLVYSVGL